MALLAQKQNKNIGFKKLFIQSSDAHFEANLSIFGKSEVKVLVKQNPLVDIKLRNEVDKIDGERNLLILKSG